MYYSETLGDSTVQLADAAAVGRILVVDDDRPFGGFVVAALESRGHDADWAGCVADALATLYAKRYDLVLIDLRLPDGSGLDLLREATDEGLLKGSAAVILTGHDFDEPNDIRVFHKPLDLEAFLERIHLIVGQTRRRRATSHAPRSAPGRASSNDGSTPRGVKIDLVLYTSAESDKSQRALRAIQRVFEQYDLSQVMFTVCDLSEQPGGGDTDAVVFTPTLVKRGPGPRTWIVGNFDQPELLSELLDVNGVSRRSERRH